MTETCILEEPSTALARRSFAKRCTLCFGAAIVVVGLLVVTRGQTLPLVARWLDVGGTPQNCDYLMVLNGTANTRPFAAAKLVQEGYADEILIAEVKISHDGEAPHERFQRVLTHLGVPPDRVHILPPGITSTYGEAKTLAAFLDTNPCATVTVVTSNFHTRRARWVVRKTTGDKFGQIHFVSAATEGFDQSNWWKKEQGVALYLSEYIKLIGYMFLYGKSAWWICACVLVTFGALSWFVVRRCRDARVTETETME